MKILILSDLYPPETIGGAEKHASSDCERLANRGHDVDVISTGVDAPRSSYKLTEKNGVTVHRFRPLNVHAPYEYQDASTSEKLVKHLLEVWNPHPYRMIKHQVQELNPDVIHIHNYRGFSGSVFNAVAVSEAPVVLTLHDYASLDFRSNLYSDGSVIEPSPVLGPLRRLVDRLVTAHVDQVLSPSQFVIDKHHKHNMFINVPSRCLQHGINICDNDVMVPENNSDSFRLLYVGRLARTKGVDLLINAVKQIDDPDLECNILGKGPEREYFESLAKDDDRIKFKGFVPESELARQYTMADFTVVPSRWLEPFGLIIYESFAHGTPVIGAKIGGIPELINDGETGFLFTPDDSDDLAATIRAHYNNSDVLTPNVKAKDVSLETHINRLINIYDSLISESGCS